MSTLCITQSAQDVAYYELMRFTDRSEVPGVTDRIHTVRIYQQLLAQPRACLADLARECRLPAAEVKAELHAMRDDGSARPTYGDAGELWEAQPPRDDTGTAIEDQRRSLAALSQQHQRAQELAELYWRAQNASSSYPAIEVIRNENLAYEQFLLIQENARDRIRCFNQPPYYADTDQQRRFRQYEIQTRRMGDGIEYLALYEDRTWERDDHTVLILDYITHGENARIAPSLPMKLVIGDDNRALLQLDPSDHDDTATLLIYPSGLLRALIKIFNQYWDIATPISDTSATPTDGSQPLTKREANILSLLSLGASDDTIGRRMGISRSTVTREVGALQKRLGAHTRFQAGLNAARRGYL